MAFDIKTEANRLAMNVPGSTAVEHELACADALTRAFAAGAEDARAGKLPWKAIARRFARRARNHLHNYREVSRELWDANDALGRYDHMPTKPVRP